MNLQSVQQKSSEPRVDDAIRSGAKDEGGLVILYLDDLSSCELQIDGHGTCWVPTRCHQLVVGVAFSVNQQEEVRQIVVASLHNR